MEPLIDGTALALPYTADAIAASAPPSPARGSARTAVATGGEPVARPRAGAIPGLVVVWTGDSPAFRPVETRRAITVGSAPGNDLVLDDPTVASVHAEIRPTATGWIVRDRGGGTQLDGDTPLVGATALARPGTVVTIGETLLLLEADLRPHREHGLRVVDGHVLGPHTAEARQTTEIIAKGGWPLLVLGETGVGKEAMAAAYHRHSRRPSGPFVAVNCANLEPGLAGAQLFGATRGAFTGADGSQQGYVPSAKGGTLFLDEVAELADGVQTRLLRVIEHGSCERIGQSRAFQVDVQVVSAAQPWLEERKDQGRFREDLYNRLSLGTAEIPPLRARREEIPWLLTTTAAETWRRLERDAKPLGTAFVRACLLEQWHNRNVRGVQRAVHKAVIRCELAGARRVEQAWAESARDVGVRGAAQVGVELLKAAIARHGGNVTAAARALGIGKTTAYRRLGRVKG